MQDEQPAEVAVELPNMSDSKKPEGEKLSTKDRLSLLFSLLALAISALSFYVANIRVDEDASVRVSSFYDEKGTLGDYATRSRDATMIARITAANGGNRPVVVEDVDLVLFGEGNSSIVHKVTMKKVVEMPIVVPPRDVRLIELRFPIKDLLGLYSKAGTVIGNPKPSSDDTRLRRIRLGFIYRFIRYSGEAINCVQMTHVFDYLPDGFGLASWRPMHEQLGFTPAMKLSETGCKELAQ